MSNIRYFINSIVVYIPIEKCTNIQLKSVPVSKD
jgi:hypothetical protein